MVDERSIRRAATFEVRRVREGQGAIVREVRLRALSTDPIAFGARVADEEAQPSTYWDDRARAHAGSDDRAIFLAIRGRDVVGLIRVERDESERDRFGLYSVWVAPDARRCGVAAALIEAAEAFCVAHGGAIAELFVSDAAPDARRLYARAGYQEDGITEATSDASVVERRRVKVLGSAVGR